MNTNGTMWIAQTATDSPARKVRALILLEKELRSYGILSYFGQEKKTFTMWIAQTVTDSPARKVRAFISIEKGDNTHGNLGHFELFWPRKKTLIEGNS